MAKRAKCGRCNHPLTFHKARGCKAYNLKTKRQCGCDAHMSAAIAAGPGKSAGASKARKSPAKRRRKRRAKKGPLGFLF